jgi:hypothetical protein
MQSGIEAVINQGDPLMFDSSLNRRIRLWALGATVFLMLAPGAAFAQATRTWVSGVGDDANPCSRTAPCKTFAGAISKTAAGGEISVLDPGGFGTVTITKSITISNTGSGEAGILASGTNGITINAATTDRITLRGLTIMGAATGLVGVRILSAGEVVIEDCQIEGFRGANPSHGILFAPSAGTSRLAIRDTTINGNGQKFAGNGGITIKPTGAAYGVVDLTNLMIANNVTGIIADSSGTSGGVFTTLRDSQVVGSNFDGVLAFSAATGTLRVALKTNTIANNGFSGVTSAGVRADGAVATVRIQDNVITVNRNGVGLTNSGIIYSYGDNIISGNSANGSFTSTQATQ